MITYTLNEYGLRDKDMQYMFDLFATYPGIEKVILYGSRAMGRFELGSDIDLAFVGNTISSLDLARIHDKLENESPTLLYFDIVDYNTIQNADLKERIDRYGKMIYQKEKH